MKYIIRYQDWNLTIDKDYQPTVTIIIPTYNEEINIKNRLEDLSRIKYPMDKISIIVIDSASIDNTKHIVNIFINAHPELSIKFIEEDNRQGKGKALNVALNYVSGEIVAMSDADSPWHPEALALAIKYLSDPKVAAITGREVIKEKNNYSNKMETEYRNIYDILRLGESKIYATPIFDGELSIFKRKHLIKFEDEFGSDDSGTAFNLTQMGLRTLFIPEVIYYDKMPKNFWSKISIKKRRALHLVQIFIRMFKLFLRKKIFLPKKIALTEIFLHIINPFFFIIFSTMSIFIVITNIILIIPLFIGMIFSKTRMIIITYILYHFILLGAIISYLMGERQIVWEKINHI